MSEHPKDRPAEPEDPLQMMAAGMRGDPLLMLDCIVEEYARFGMDEEQILMLFSDPVFLATYGLREVLGAEETARRVCDVLSRCGVLRVRASALPPQAPCERS